MSNLVQWSLLSDLDIEETMVNIWAQDRIIDFVADRACQYTLFSIMYHDPSKMHILPHIVQSRDAYRLLCSFKFYKNIGKKARHFFDNLVLYCIQDEF